MKTREEYDSNVAQLERLFKTDFPAEPCFPPPKDSSEVPRGAAQPKARVSSVVCGMLAGSLILGIACNQPRAEQYTSVPSPSPSPGLSTYYDPHTIEGAAAIHEMMQSGTVNVSRSTITGIVDRQTMTASLYWTFLLQNNESQDKEASITVDLPKNSVVSRATLWINGKPQEASFSSNQQVQNAYDSIVVRHRDPLLVTQIAPNRIKILAAPVTAHGGTMQFRLGITTPTQRAENGRDFVSMPHIVESNLKFDSKQDIHLTSDTKISGIGETDRAGIYTLKANVAPSDLDKIKVELRQGSTNAFATRLTHTYPQEYVEARVVDNELELTRTTAKPTCQIINDDDAAFRLSNLWAHQEIERQAAAGKINDACNIANVYRIVSSVSGATVLEEQYDYDNNGLNRDMYRVLGRKSSTGGDFTTVQGFVPYHAANASAGGDAFAGADDGDMSNRTPNRHTGTETQVSQSELMAPHLQGATNGTIGPQGLDATVVAGVNTAGTVRVNNYAGLEAILNVIACAVEVLGIAIACFMLSESAVNDGLRAPVRVSRIRTLVLGLFIGAIALMTPNILIYAIGCMRQANMI